MSSLASDGAGDNVGDEGPAGTVSGGGLVAYRRADWPDIRRELGGLIGERARGLLGQDGGISGARGRIRRWGDPEAVNPFDFFPAIFCLNLDGQPERCREARGRYRMLGIAGRVERFSAVATPENHHRGCALSWRAMIAEAERRGYEQVLIFEDDALFLDTTIPVLRAATAEVGDREWELFFLGAAVWSREFPFVPGGAALQVCGPVTLTHALAVHRRAFDAWLVAWLAVDQYFSRKIADGTFRALITAPRVATQPALRSYADADRALGGRYVIWLG